MAHKTDDESFWIPPDPDELTPAQVRRLLAAVEADVDMSLIMKRFNVGITKIRRLMAAAKREKQI